jgi:GWxTD domain-containing protein
VVYIIAPEERAAFLLLKSDAERSRFIAGFWARRNPDPDAPSNSYVKEHYRRLIFANEHFGGSIEGWKSDRGRIYVMWGAPDSIDTFADGIDCEDRETHAVVHDAPARITWNYRYLEGIGENVHIDFLQPRPTGESRGQDSPFKYSQSPCEFTANPIAGKVGSLFTLPDAEPDTANIDSTRYLQDAEDQLPGRHPDPKLDRALAAPPSDPQFPLRVRFDAVRATSVTSLATIRVSIPTAAVTFPVAKDQPARATVLGRLKNSVAGGQDFAFSSNVTLSRTDLPSSNWTNVYDDQMPLAAGNYELELAVRDEETGIVSTQFSTVSVPTTVSVAP